MAKILVQVLYDSRDLRSLIIFFSKLVIWDSLSKISFRVTPYFDEKQKNIFRFRSSRALSQGFSNIKTKPNKTKQNKNKNKNKNKTKQNKTKPKQNKTKQNKTKQNKTKHIFSNLSHIGLLYKQHPALVKEHSIAHWITIQCSSLGIFWINEIKFVIMRLESIVHSYTIWVIPVFY